MSRQRAEKSARCVLSTSAVSTPESPLKNFVSIFPLKSTKTTTTRSHIEKPALFREVQVLFFQHLFKELCRIPTLYSEFGISGTVLRDFFQEFTRQSKSLLQDLFVISVADSDITFGMQGRTRRKHHAFFFD